MATITLRGTGQKMPVHGFGLWKVTKSSCADTVYNAIKAGYRLLDGAGDYGNEKEAGEGLARAIKDGLVKREEIFVTSKLWNTFHSREQANTIARKQLADWGLEYFDLYLIHFPVSLEYVSPDRKYPPEWWGLDGDVHLDKVPIQETWQALEDLYQAGLAKNIGLSNFAGGLILDVFRYAKIKPSVLQIEHHPYLVQQPLLKLAKTLGLAVTGYSSFGPQSFLELGAGHDIPSLLKHDVIGKIAARAERTTAQVLLRWTTQRGLAIVPKSNSLERLTENLKLDFDLTEQEIKDISALETGKRFNDPAEIHPELAIFA